MFKLIDSSSFFKDKEPHVQIINFDNLNGLTKQAADDRISAFSKSITPHPNKIYIHINAMGAGEYYGSNKNGDFFPEDNLKQHYHSFESAHVFRHHVNKDPARSIGKVLFAIYNDRMHRVELVAEVDKFLGSDIEDRISMGDFPSTSMACKTPYDVCSICGNKAHTRQEYCEHLRTDLGQLVSDGRRVMALNVGPLKFFDISIVLRPADVTSSVLQKVAFVDTDVIGSAELAEREGLTDDFFKQASFKKLADIIKEITGEVDVVSGELDKILFNTKDPDPGVIRELRLYSLPDTLAVLAELGISPSIEFLAELIARKILGEKGRGMGKLISQLMENIDSEKAEVPNIQFEKPEKINPLIVKLMSPYVEQASLLPEYVEKRAMMGYASFNPNGYEEPVKEKPENIRGLTPLSKTLLAIGGAAILAKIFISRLIEQKLKENNRNNPKYNAKIVIVKQAADYQVAYNLTKYSAQKAVKKDKKKLNNVADVTKNVLKVTDTKLGSKLSKAIKTIQLGSKAVDKYTKGT